jgi:hypothetical protein
MEPKIELAKLRDFGEVISDTFQFIRQNFKELLKYFFIFCGFFLLAGASSAFLQQYQMMDFMKDNSSGPPTFASNLSDVWVRALFAGISALLTYTAIPVTVLSYMALYKEKGKVPPTTEEVWGYFKYYFFKTLLALFVTTLLMVPAFMLCLIPGFWLFPIMGLVVPIIIMENSSFGYAFNRAFNLIKDYWWVTTGTVLVVYIIFYFMAMFITLPVQAINVTSLLLRPQKIPHLSTGGILLSVIVTQFTMVLYIIPTIALALCYFNLSEAKEGTSLLDRINKFGTPGQETNLPTEEY